MSLRVLIAPSGFKESLCAEEVAECIETGVRQALPDVEVFKVPLADGGEGFARTLVNATDGTIIERTVTGPIGEPVSAHFGLMGGEGPRTAVLEMAAAAGLRLVPSDLRDPLATTTFGVGELIGAALDAGAERILLGCGDSGTCDGGAGMAQALGVRLLDADGKELARGGADLERLAKIDLTGRDPRLDRVQIDVACNWHNVLCGPNGVARVFGPQKGASEETVERLDAALTHYADVLAAETGMDVHTSPGSGASGGLGAGVQALLGATLHSRYDIVMQYLRLDELLQKVDLVFTAEGSLDFQTPRGKIPAEVGARAKQYGLPVIALAGTLGKDAQVNLEHGIDAFASIQESPMMLPEAMEHACEWLEHAAEQAMRLALVGRSLPQDEPAAVTSTAGDG